MEGTAEISLTLKYGTDISGGERERLKAHARPSWASQVAQIVKNLPFNAGDMGLIPGLGRSPGEGHGNPLQYSRLDNPMDKGAWQAKIRGVTKSQI